MLSSERSPSSEHAVVATRRPRKGHKKSRKGCFTCKRRKIKCGEESPICLNCDRMSLHCQYPRSLALQPSPIPVVTLSTTTNTFSLIDMRLFHHYLSTAYPHFPLNSESQWLNYITPIGHRCEYLMHALLALSASHLEKLAPSGLKGAARRHAQLAMAGLNSAMEYPAQTQEAGDAVIACCYALMMQSWYMDDGLPMFLILSRSCRAVSGEVRSLALGSVFAEHDRMARVRALRSKFEAAPAFSSIFIEDALQSIGDVRLLCQQDFELNMIDQLADLFDKLHGSPYEAYLKYLEIDEMISMMDADDCQVLIDSTETTSQLVLAHMIAMYLIMRPISCRERRQYTATMYGIRMTEWIDGIYKKLDERFKNRIAWPLMVSELNRLKILEQYTLSDGGSAQWDQRFIDGSTPFSAWMTDRASDSSTLVSTPLTEGNSS